MADCIDLLSILADNGLNKDDQVINCRIVAKDRNKIAVKISDWKSCAAFLGLAEQDVDDIIEENRRVRHRRIAMLRRWDERNGQEATYLKLAECLASMGRRDLIELLILEPISQLEVGGCAHERNRKTLVLRRTKQLILSCKYCIVLCLWPSLMPRPFSHSHGEKKSDPARVGYARLVNCLTPTF